MTEEQLLELGFIKNPINIILTNYNKPLSRNRTITVSNPGTFNEIVILSDHHPDNYKLIENVVVVYNYDYDKFTSIEKLKTLISVFE